MNDKDIVKQNGAYTAFLDDFYKQQLGSRAKFSMRASLTPALISEDESNGFVNKYEFIKKYLEISQEIFKESLDGSVPNAISSLILNEVNSEYSFEYHKKLYSRETSLPHFFRTDESVPGKISEIQFSGSLWGMVCALQKSLDVMREFVDVPIRSYNRHMVSEVFAGIVTELTKNNPIVFHQIDESSNMQDMNLFIELTRQSGLKYLGWDYDASLRNVNFIRTHSFMEMVTNSGFEGFLNKYYDHELLFDIFPSVLFFQKIPLIFPFWEETRDRYPDEVRDIFPFSSLVRDNQITVDSGETMTIDQFSNLGAHERDYYLKYAGMDGSINWGAKSVYHLGNSRQQCKKLLQSASDDFNRKKCWTIQKANHRKEEVVYVSGDGEVKKDLMYTKYSGFYGPKGFMGGHVMTRTFYKVHGQNEGVCRLIL